MAQVTDVGPVYPFIGDPTEALGAGMTFLGGVRDGVAIRVTPHTSGGRSDHTGMNERWDSQYDTGLDVEIAIPLLDEEKQKIDAILPAGSRNTSSVTRTYAAWASGTAYVTGDIVTVSSATYRSLRDHTSASGDVADGSPDEGNSTAWQAYTPPALEALGHGGGKFTEIAADDVPTLCLIPVRERGVGANGVDAPNGHWFPGVRLTPTAIEFSRALPDSGADDSLPRHVVTFKALYREEDQEGNDIEDGYRVYFRGPPIVALGSDEWSLPAPTP